MQNRAFLLGGLLAVLALATGSGAQEGHPLTGTWSGDWGPSVTDRRHLTVVMNWNGEEVTGMINPGPDSTPLGGVFLDVTSWTVRLEAAMEEDSGGTVPVRAEGRLENLESYHRTITGTWRQGDVEGDFVLTRD